MEKNIYEEKIKPLKEKEFDELTKNLSSGIPISTPVFDGASVDDVTELLKLAELTFIRTNKFMGWKNRRKI